MRAARPARVTSSGKAAGLCSPLGLPAGIAAAGRGGGGVLVSGSLAAERDLVVPRESRAPRPLPGLQGEARPHSALTVSLHLLQTELLTSSKGHTKSHPLHSASLMKTRTLTHTALML